MAKMMDTSLDRMRTRCGTLDYLVHDCVLIRKGTRNSNEQPYSRIFQESRCLVFG